MHPTRGSRGSLRCDGLQWQLLLHLCLHLCLLLYLLYLLCLLSCCCLCLAGCNAAGQMLHKLCRR
jgi:hypothetical protein